MAAPKSNGRLAFGLLAFVVLMVGASFAAVPFYSWFCRVTGYAGTTGVAEAPENDSEIVDRLVTVHFDANIAPDMPWEFKPKQLSITLKLGETGLAFYEAYNPTDQVLAGQAGYNVTPFSVGGYFDKIACFCFTMQVLQPHERIDMPVSFYVDPAMLDDRESTDVTNITLSYTMYPADLPEDENEDSAAAAPVRTPTDITRLAAAPADRGQTIER